MLFSIILLLSYIGITESNITYASEKDIGGQAVSTDSYDNGYGEDISLNEISQNNDIESPDNVHIENYRFLTLDDLKQGDVFLGLYSPVVRMEENFISLMLKNKQINNYIFYRFDISDKLSKMTFIDDLGQKNLLALNTVNTTKAIKEYFGTYSEKTELALEDPDILRKNGYELDRLPVIIILDISKKYNELKSELVDNLDTLSADQLRNKLDYLKKDAFKETWDEFFDSSGINANSIFDRRELDIINGFSAEIKHSDLDGLKNNDLVKKISIDKPVKAFLYDSVAQINATQVWKMYDDFGRNITGRNVTIAILDTGVDYTHPDLGGCFGAGCKVIGGYDYVNSDSDPMDDHGHGTHCAATSAGNGTLLGVAPDAYIYAYKVLDSGGSGYTSDIIDAIQGATDPDGNGDTSDHVDVISMSLGGYGNPDDELSQAADAAVDAGVAVVVAAGNSGPYSESIGSPGCARKVITVGASCKTSQVGVDSYCDEKIAYFSSRGPADGGLIKPDVVAPGVDICAAQYDNYQDSSQCLDSSHIAISGTSMATPHVAGAVALLLQNHEWSPQTLKSVLMLTAEDFGYDANTQGSGEIRPADAINASFIVNPTSISFGTVSGITSLNTTFNITNIKTDNISIRLYPGHVTDEDNNSYSIASLNVSTANLTVDGMIQVGLELDLSQEIGGTLNGNVIIEESGHNYTISYSFQRVSTINVEVVGLGKDLFPSSIIFHDDNISNVIVEYQGDTFYGNDLSVKVKPGNYTIYAIGDYYDEDLEYILIDHITIETDSTEDVTLDLADARLFNVNSKSLDGRLLHMYEWEKSIIGYGSEESFTCSYFSGKTGQRKIYLSNNPSNINIDIVLKYRGVPYD
ncbi:S8 family serine peptidase [Candidatus Woesearchaeota archaeon]|nr:S8 family serine peptidase [Candidatus Woesearchaeota archaeon]